MIRFPHIYAGEADAHTLGNFRDRKATSNSSAA
jgi:hypothetical protein